MVIRELDCGFFEGIPEESDPQFDVQTFGNLVEALSISTPDLLKDLAAQGFQSLPQDESERLQETLKSVVKLTD